MSVEETRVVNVQRSDFDVYIGRGFRSYKASRYQNPYIIGPDGTREEVLLKFCEYWYSPERALLRRAALVELTGKRLGCWCEPQACHGQIIAGYLAWKLMPASVEIPREPLHEFFQRLISMPIQHVESVNG